MRDSLLILLLNMKQQGTIYFDESSRGYHHNVGHTPYTRGRWVGEKTVDGRRLRMRSTDYTKVVNWLNQFETKRKKVRADINGLTQVMGFSDYYVDLENRTVYRKNGLKIQGYLMRGRRYYSLSDDGKRKRISHSRLFYAVLHSINPNCIPSCLIVKQDSYGNPCLVDKKKDAGSLYRSSIEKRKKSFELKVIEDNLLLEYYKKGTSASIINYIMDIQSKLIGYTIKTHRVNMDKAKDVTFEAIELFCQRLRDGVMVPGSISGTIKTYIGNIISLKKKHTQLYDWKNYKSIDSAI